MKKTFSRQLLGRLVRESLLREISEGRGLHQVLGQRDENVGATSKVTTICLRNIS